MASPSQGRAKAGPKNGEFGFVLSVIWVEGKGVNGEEGEEGVAVEEQGGGLQHTVGAARHLLVLPAQPFQ